ncbi:sensor histidine kinase [Tessaracoccus caeni]|uniref:sensor histidine kinase n=1 Tax=Tessaracoccus caeni TaxID=3031239 RepID=UPI0023D9C5A2|nr:histidine kinase [Tessaracoccus caeni]MDF1488713.1 histidine kinase [Tessaracoccus caeni]
MGTSRKEAPADRGPRSDRRADTWASHVPYLAAIGVALYFTWEGGSARPTWAWPFQLALLPLVIAAIVWRDRWPYAFPLLGLIELGSSVGFVYYSLGMISLSIRRRGWPVWSLVAGAGVVIIVLSMTVLSEDGVPLATGLVTLLINIVSVCLPPVLIGTYVRVQRERLARTVEETTRAELEREHAAQQAAQAERDRVAHELHDSLGRALTLVTMQAGALEVSTRDPELAASARQVRETARSGLAELRTVVRALGEDSPDDVATAGI